MARPRGNVQYTKVTGLFRSTGKNKGRLWIGSTDDERLEGLIDKIKEARKEKKQLTFFLWKSEYEDGPVYNLNVDVAQDRKDRPRSRPRPIKNDDFDEPDPEEAAEEPEAEDADPFD